MIIRRMHRKMINSFFHNKQHHSLMTVWTGCFIFVGISSAIIFLKLTEKKKKNSSSTITRITPVRQTTNMKCQKTFLLCDNFMICTWYHY